MWYLCVGGWGGGGDMGKYFFNLVASRVANIVMVLSLYEVILVLSLAKNINTNDHNSF